MARYEVLKPFTWDGKTLGRGDNIDMEQGSKADSMVRSKFIRLANESPENPTSKPEKVVKTKKVEMSSSEPAVSGDVVVYCVKCKTKRPVKDTKLVTLKHGRQAMQGICSVCGTKLHRMKKKSE